MAFTDSLILHLSFICLVGSAVGAFASITSSLSSATLTYIISFAIGLTGLILYFVRQISNHGLVFFLPGSARRELLSLTPFEWLKAPSQLSQLIKDHLPFLPFWVAHSGPNVSPLFLSCW